MTPASPLFHFENGMTPSALLSDMDGLLLDTEQLSKISFDDVTRAHNIPNADEIFPRLIGLNKASHFEIFNTVLPPHISAHQFNQDWMDSYLSMLANHVPVKQGVPSFLRMCRARGMAMAVVTSSQTDKANDFLTRAGLIEFFDIVIGGDQVTNGKPHPDIYLKAADMLGVTASDCLALEDSNNGVMAAYQSGAKVVQIPDLAPQSSDAAALEIPVVTSISDLPAYLGWHDDNGSKK